MSKKLLNRIDSLLNELEHWRNHCYEVDAICDEYDIPVEDTNGNRIFTEDRVRLLITKIRIDNTDN